MIGIKHEPFAHPNIETLSQNLSSRAERGMVGNQQQRAAIAHPLANSIAFLFGESRLVRTLIVHILGPKRICNHQKLKRLQRLFTERLAISRDVITVAED